MVDSLHCENVSLIKVWRTVLCNDGPRAAAGQAEAHAAEALLIEEEAANGGHGYNHVAQLGHNNTRHREKENVAYFLQPALAASLLR